MIKVQNHTDACQILGISDNADRNTWKNAYRGKCHIYHPDVLPENDPDRESNIENYILVCKAYEFLEQEFEAGKRMGVSDNIASPKSNVTKKATGPKIMGGPVTSSAYNTSGRKRVEEKLKVKESIEKERKLKELKQRADEIKQKEKEQKILDEIRWIRLAGIIHKTIEEDKKRN